MMFVKRVIPPGFVLACAVALAAIFGVPLCASHSFAWAPMDDPLGEDLSGPQGVYCLRPPWVYTHDVGKVTLQVTNLGFFGNPYIEALSFGWQGGEYLYVAGLWVGGVDEDNVPHVSTAAYETEFRPPLSNIDHIYASYEGIPGGKRFGPGGSGDDDNDGKVDEDFQNGYDDDGDGRIDEDYAAIGQQMFSCQYRDDTQEAKNRFTEHVPWGLKVQQRSFGWAVTGSNEFIGVDYNIVHEGSKEMRNVFVGFFVDGDVGPKGQRNPGYWEDDLVGFADTLVQIYDPTQVGQCQVDTIRIQICYMWDCLDNGTTCKAGNVDGYAGVMFLGHKTDLTGATAPESVKVATVRWFSSTAPYPEGDPRTDPERYDLMASRRIPTRNATVARDYRYLLCAGPFPSFQPGESLPFQVAFVVGKGFDGMLRNAISAQRIYNGRFFDIYPDPYWGFNGKESKVTCDYPGCYKCVDDDCDSTSACKIIKENASIAADLDCNKCTGVEGKESLVHWVGSTAPPPPAWNNDPNLPDSIKVMIISAAGDRKVTLQWDNGSEIIPDPLTGQFRFEGYRVWKAANWKRPIGETGPSDSLWMMMGDFAYHPIDSLGAESPRYVLNTKQWPGETPHIMCDTSLVAVDTTTYMIPKEGGGKDTVTVYQYPIGRYTFTDYHVINGMVYFYSITPYAKWYDTEAKQWVEIQTQPAATEDISIIPRADSQSKLGKVTVVPNPYIQQGGGIHLITTPGDPDSGRYVGGVAWDLVPSDIDPTGTKIGFFGLPKCKSTLRIFSLAGDLIREIPHDGSNGNGTVWWNLVTRNGQDVVSGVYLFSVESDWGTYVGKFVIIR